MYRILIADDEKMVRDLLVKSIGKLDIDAKVAAVAGDGREALSLAREVHPDIVITDIAMPFMNGLELIETLQKEGISSKNIIISGYDEFDYARKAIALGVQNYLLKPFLPKDIHTELKKIIHELDQQELLQQNMKLLESQAQQNTVLAKGKAVDKLLSGQGSKKEFEEIGLNPDASLFTAGIFGLSGQIWNFESQEKVEEFLAQSQNLWDLTFLVYFCLLMSSNFRKKYSSSG